MLVFSSLVSVEVQCHISRRNILQQVPGSLPWHALTFKGSSLLGEYP